MTQTKEEKNAKRRAHYAAHKDEFAAKRKVYYDAHKEENAARCKAYYYTHKAESKAYRDAHKEERAANRKAYYEAHKEEEAARSKAYNAAHKEENAARRKAYYEAHKDVAIAYRKAYYEANKEEIASKKKAYNEAHKEENAAYCKAYREAHSEEIKAYKHEYSLKWKALRPTQLEFLNVIEGQSEITDCGCEYVVDTDNGKLVMQKELPQYPDIIICSNGVVLSSGRKIPRKQYVSSNGYVSVRTNNGGYESLHRLVAKAFVPNTSADKTQVHHKDGNPLNNDYTNLEWVSTSEHNAITARLNKCNITVMQDENVAKFKSISKAARFLDVSTSTVREALRNGVTINGWSVFAASDVGCDSETESMEVTA